jgi:hypothetical protein
MSTTPTSTPTPQEQAIRDFHFEQVELWNAGRQEDFMALYRRTAPAGLTLEYVGKQTLTGDAAWAGLAHMWVNFNSQVKLQLFECIVNGQDSACYFRNLWGAPQTLSTGIETFSFRSGALHARFFH